MHLLTSDVGNGSNSQDLHGELEMILRTSDSLTGSNMVRRTLSGAFSLNDSSVHLHLVYSHPNSVFSVFVYLQFHTVSIETIEDVHFLSVYFGTCI